MTLEHNPHLNVYDTVKQTLEDYDPYGWKSDESRQRAIDTNEIWTLQWFQDTPIGSYSIAAPTLEELLEIADRVGDEHSRR